MIIIVRDIDHPDRNGTARFCDRCGSRIDRIYTSRPEESVKDYVLSAEFSYPDLCRACAEKESEGAKADSR